MYIIALKIYHFQGDFRTPVKIHMEWFQKSE